MRYEPGQIVIIDGKESYKFVKDPNPEYDCCPNTEDAIAVIHGVEGNKYLCIFNIFENGKIDGSWQDGMIVSEENIKGELKYGTKIHFVYNYGNLSSTAIYESKFTVVFEDGRIIDLRDIVSKDLDGRINVIALEPIKCNYSEYDKILNDIFSCLGN